MSSSVGLVLAFINWFFVSTNDAMHPWVVAGSVVALMFSAFGSWKDVYLKLERALSDRMADPRIVLPGDALVAGQITLTRSKPALFHNPSYSVIWLNVKNEPLNNTPDSIAKGVRATVKFYKKDGKLLFQMDARWADTSQPADASNIPNLMDLLSVDIPIGQTRKLDIGFKDEATGECFAFNNENFQYPELKHPGRRLAEDPIIAHVVLTGVRVNRIVRLQVHNKPGMPLKPATYDISDGG